MSEAEFITKIAVVVYNKDKRWGVAWEGGCGGRLGDGNGGKGDM